MEELLSTHCVVPPVGIWAHVPAVVGVGAGLAAFNRHTPTSVRTRQGGREVQIEEVAPECRAVRGLGGGAGTDYQDLLGARPAKREFSLEQFGVRVRLLTLADGGGDARYGRGAPLFFLRFLKFGNSRPLPNTDLDTKNKTAMIPDEKSNTSKYGLEVHNKNHDKKLAYYLFFSRRFS